VSRSERAKKSSDPGPIPNTRFAGVVNRAVWPDVIAGISVGLVLIPQSLAYAQLAGFPATRGLFAASIPALVAAPFASSAYLQPGPTAVTALLTYGALSQLAQPGSTKYVELGLLLALFVGLIRLAVGLMRAGVIAYLMSEPLIIGFVPAAAILIIGSQLPAALGTASHEGNQLVGAWHVMSDPGTWKVSSILITLVSVAILRGGKRIHPLFPGVLVAVVAAVVVSDLSGYDGATLGSLDAGWPGLTTSLPLGSAPELLLPAFVISLLGFVEAASIARTYAALDRSRWNANREFFSQGLANIAAGSFGGFPVGASFSRSALNRLAGAKTRMSGFVTGLTVVIFLPFASGLSALPLPVLAATVIAAVVPLVRLGKIIEIARLSRWQLAVTLSAFGLTLATAPHLEWGIITAISLSVVIHLWWELRLDFHSSYQDRRLELIPEGVLWFGTARSLEDRFVDLLSDNPETQEVVLRLDRLGRIDLTGALALRSIVTDARHAGLVTNVQGTPAHSSRVVRRVFHQAASSTHDETMHISQGGL
jgi:SulP family sulfate permease